MKFLEGKTPAEKKKVIAASALGLISFIAIFYVFFGDSFFGSSTQRPAVRPSPTPARGSSNTTAGPRAPVGQEQVFDMASLTPVVYSPATPPDPAVGRNIFAFYVPPPPPAKVVPTPAPPRPADYPLSSLSPANVFAQTAAFTLVVAGDKFTPDCRITFDSNPLPTKFISPQQLQAEVPAAMIANDGSRMIKVISSADPAKFSTDATLVVQAPPKPLYDYIALIGDRHYQNDVAMLKSKSNSKELISVQRGDLVSGRFRVTSISEAEVAMVDTNLNIKHAIHFSTDKSSGGGGVGKGGGIESGNDIRRFPPARLQPDPGTSIPGIPDNIPRYTPPPQPQTREEPEDEDDGKP
jgi:hypothetical protein